MPKKKSKLGLLEKIFGSNVDNTKVPYQTFIPLILKNGQYNTQVFFLKYFLLK